MQAAVMRQASELATRSGASGLSLPFAVVRALFVFVLAPVIVTCILSFTYLRSDARARAGSASTITAASSPTIARCRFSGTPCASRCSR